MNPIRKQVIVAAAVVSRKNARGEEEILITQRQTGDSFAGYWEFPGGKVRPGEPPTAAAARECQEECAIEIEVGDIADVAHHVGDDKDLILLFYYATWLSGEVQHLSVADHRWVTASELVNYKMPPADTPLILKLARSTGG